MEKSYVIHVMAEVKSRTRFKILKLNTVMKKPIYLVLFAFIALVAGTVQSQAQDIQSGNGLESLLNTDNDDVPLTKSEMKALWKKMKKVEKEQRSVFAEHLTTKQVLQMKEWLGKEKTTRLIGGWMMILSPVVLVGIPALGRATSDEYDSNGRKETPQWSQTVAGIGFPVMLFGGAVLWGRGNKRYNTSRLLIADTPIKYDFNIMNYHANTSLKIMNDPISNRYVVGTGVTLTF